MRIYFKKLNIVNLWTVNISNFDYDMWVRSMTIHINSSLYKDCSNMSQKFCHEGQK
jgi:hypothetical protein